MGIIYKSKYIHSRNAVDLNRFIWFAITALWCVVWLIEFVFVFVCELLWIVLTATDRF